MKLIPIRGQQTFVSNDVQLLLHTGANNGNLVDNRLNTKVLLTLLRTFQLLYQEVISIQFIPDTYIFPKKHSINFLYAEPCKSD